jgi:2,3-diketo-5-methylthio-1-phosphopentane phosphatase
MMQSVKVPYEECKEVLRQNIDLDPGFLEFYTWCKENGIPLIIVSSGMAPIIRAVLEKLVGVQEASQMEIIANDVKYTDAEGKGNTWDIVYRHPESGFGHDKSQSIIPYRSIPSRPTLFFAGDGVSDLSAARHADLLFTKVKPEGNTDLAKFCDREGIPHVNFLDFRKVLTLVKEVVAGKSTEQVIKENQ